MQTLLAWHNTFHSPKRCGAAAAGIAFAVLLIFMEVGFLDAAKLNAALLYKGLDFDIAIVSRGYVSMQRTLPVNAFRILQARSTPGVASAVPLWIDGAHWLNPLNHRLRSCRVIGIRPDDAAFVDPEINAQLPLIKSAGTMLVDRLSSRRYGPWEYGGVAHVDNIPLRVAGTFAMGTGLIADGGVIVSPETFERVSGRSPRAGFDLGLVRVAPGHDPAEVAAALEAALPGDVLVLTKSAIIAREQFFWVNLKPVGIMFRVGAIVAFLIGAVVLYQVLALEISNRLHEFATMKALGYAPVSIYGVGAGQALILSLLGYVPACLLALGLYGLVFDHSRLPLFMEAGRALRVFAIMLAMCGIAAILAFQKLRRADPAELFR